MPDYPTIEAFVGNTPLVRLQRLDTRNNHNTILVKLEGNNPAGSVKDRPAMNMVAQAEANGHIKPGDTLVEATSGNTGIALAMAAAIRGYKMVLIMPDNMTMERRASMAAFGAELILVPEADGMEAARDLAEQMQREGKAKLIDQFGNPHNPEAHILGTGPEIWRDTEGEISHFVSAMGTTGTITGTGTYLKQQNPNVQVIGVYPDEDAQIAGIRNWPEAYRPTIFKPELLDRIIEVSQSDAENTTRALAKQEGIFCGVSAGGAVAAALKLSQEVSGATIVTIIPDRGDRYLSAGIF